LVPHFPIHAAFSLDAYTHVVHRGFTIITRLVYKWSGTGTHAYRKPSAVKGDKTGDASSDDEDTTLGPDFKKILRLFYDVIITYDNRKSNLR